MLQKLQIHNYKCFADQTVPFQALTLLTGLNGTGKSTVIQSLLLLRQFAQQIALLSSELAGNASVLKPLRAQDLAIEDREENNPSFQLHLHQGHQQIWQLLYNRATDALSLSVTPADEQAFHHSSLFGANFAYLPADRTAPQQFSVPWGFLAAQSHQLAPVGEPATTRFLQMYGNKTQVFPGLAHPDAASLDLQSQVEAWISEIGLSMPNPISSEPRAKKIDLDLPFVERGISSLFPTTNMSLGLASALPILVTVLSSQPGGLILVENPETHLHPKGQIFMGRLFARAARCGTQVILKTHSDCVLNAIRVAVHDGQLAPESVAIHFFQRQRDGQTQIISPHIDRNGRLDQWPDGLFDELDKSLASLIVPAK